eukprot:7902889-Alexandrium_andersonii.AAC.1
MPGLDASARLALGGHVEDDHPVAIPDVSASDLEHVLIARPGENVLVRLGAALQHPAVADHRL